MLLRLCSCADCCTPAKELCHKCLFPLPRLTPCLVPFVLAFAAANKCSYFIRLVRVGVQLWAMAAHDYSTGAAYSEDTFTINASE